MLSEPHQDYHRIIPVVDNEILGEKDHPPMWENTLEVHRAICEVEGFQQGYVPKVDRLAHHFKKPWQLMITIKGPMKLGIIQR